MDTIEQAIAKAGSGRALSVVLGVSSSTVALWRHGKSIPSVASAAKIEDFMGVPGVAYAIGEEFWRCRDLESAANS